MEVATRRSSFAISYPSSWRRGCPARLPSGRQVGVPFCRRRRPPLRLQASSAPDANGHLEPLREPDPVDVIGIGSRKDAVIDFCLASSLASSSSLRFWLLHYVVSDVSPAFCDFNWFCRTIHSRDSLKVQLLQRCHGTDVVLRNVEFPLSLHPCPPAVIIVASAGHGVDDITAAELLNAAKSAGGLAAAILLKPFSFEGQRRMEEVDDLVKKLKECSHFYIVVEADSLLKTEVETLAEALESANNAVFLAINTISVLMSETHMKFFNTPDEKIKEVKPLEVLKLLESCGEAKVGFGAGYNIKAAIIQAVFHCPFLSGGMKDINGPVIFTLTSACTMEESDMLSVILTFRRITEYNKEIIFSRIYEPDLEPNLVVTTLLIVGCSEKMVSQKWSFLSGLALHFPFIFSLLGRGSPEKNDKLSVHSPSQPSVDVISSGSRTLSILDLFNGALKSISSYTEEMEAEQSSKEASCENKRSRVESSEVCHGSVTESHNQTNGEVPSVQREEPIGRNIGPGFHIAQFWAKERATLMEINKIDNLDILTLHVGVKSSMMCSGHSPYLDHTLPETSDDTSRESLGTPNLPSKETNAGLEAISDIYNSALTLLKGRNADESRKGGLLSVRAASMLEAERESEKSWTPIIEIQYRGGTFRGRCQGGLPEGKGRLTYMDGSFYDGMWRYGKRYGLGTFCYSNGDMFQGAWRDDLMHGKGWFYFHSGDRWFANFWKGKANGEGRLYSKNGCIFFGHFQNGWRHGQSLCIDIDGSRWTETWDEGVLVSRTHLDREACG